MSKKLEARANNILYKRGQDNRMMAVYKPARDPGAEDDSIDIVDANGNELGVSIQLCAFGGGYAVNMYAGQYKPEFAHRGAYFTKDLYYGEDFELAVTEAAKALEGERAKG